MDFKLTSKYKPTGDQPEAIKELTEGLERGDKSQVLLGVTGSGKTFTMANVIANVNKPTLILSHNKTLAAQLFEEMKGFFPQNAVEYYVSYYDYYQPEAYMPSTDTYIEKDLAINDEIDKLRLSAVSSLLSGRKDVIVVSSVSCIYGMGGPVAMKDNVIRIKKGQILDRNIFLRQLVNALYVRNDIDLQRGNFRVKGDTVDIAMAYSDNILRVTWWDDEIDAIEEVDSVSYHRLGTFEEYEVYPANLFVTSKEQTENAIRQIQDDLTIQIDFFNEIGDSIKAQRIKERVEYDIEMIKELGHCSGIENYSRYFDGREAGQRPYCLLDFFPEDNLIIIDEEIDTIETKKVFEKLFDIIIGKRKKDKERVIKLEELAEEVDAKLRQSYTINRNYKIHDVLAKIMIFKSENIGDELVKDLVDKITVIEKAIAKNFVISEETVLKKIEELKMLKLPVVVEKDSENEMEYELALIRHKYEYDNIYDEEEVKYVDTTANEIKQIIEYIKLSI